MKELSKTFKNVAWEVNVLLLWIYWIRTFRVARLFIYVPCIFSRFSWAQKHRSVRVDSTGELASTSHVTYTTACPSVQLPLTKKYVWTSCKAESRLPENWYHHFDPHSTLGCVSMCFYMFCVNIILAVTRQLSRDAKVHWGCGYFS
jgi:hypothetical protein